MNGVNVFVCGLKEKEKNNMNIGMTNITAIPNPVSLLVTIFFKSQFIID